MHTQNNAQEKNIENNKRIKKKERRKGKKSNKGPAAVLSSINPGLACFFFLSSLISPAGNQINQSSIINHFH